MRLLYEHMAKENNKTAAAAVSATTTTTTTTAAATTTTTTTPSPCQCPPPSDLDPELSSLIDYLNKWNYSSIYGPASNFIFLWNVCTNQIPPHSRYWHPQNLKEWIDAQPGNATFGVIFALFARLLDSGLAKRLARKYKVNPSAWGYVKMTQDSLFFSFCLKVTRRRIRQPATSK
jgi:hypothetical protein